MAVIDVDGVLAASGIGEQLRAVLTLSAGVAGGVQSGRGRVVRRRPQAAR